MFKNKIESKFVWDSDTFTKSDILYELNEITESNLLRFKTDYLNSGYGIGIINLKGDNEIDSDYFVKISQYLGTLLEQNIHGEKVVEVKDMGQSLLKGGRYHYTRDGGSLHTDCPQWEERPDYLGMLCIHPAKEGGTSKFISSYTIHNKLLKDQSLLICLYENFHFDKRGEVKEGEDLTTIAPIFNIENGILNFRYLADYVYSSYALLGEQLSERHKKALKNLDDLLENKKLIVSFDLVKGDLIYVNNLIIAHGRGSFIDHSDKNKKRRILRTWIKNRN